MITKKSLTETKLANTAVQCNDLTEVNISFVEGNFTAGNTGSYLIFMLTYVVEVALYGLEVYCVSYVVHAILIVFGVSNVFLYYFNISKA